MELLDEPDRAMPGFATIYLATLNLFIAAIWTVYQKGSRTTRVFTKLIGFISYSAKALKRRFEAIIAWKQVVKEEATRVPTFYGAEIASNSFTQWSIVIFLAAAFAMVHALAAYLPKFPTSIELKTWIYSTLVIAMVPSLFLYIYPPLYHLRQGWPTLTAKFTPLLAGTYILARIILFVLGFTTLRGLPPQALNTIQWPNYILIFIGN